MASFDTISISYKGKEYAVAFIPNVFTSDDTILLIGSHSLNKALYDEDKGYLDNEAREIDEQVYAYIDDDSFSLSLENFIKKAKAILD